MIHGFEVMFDLDEQGFWGFVWFKEESILPDTEFDELILKDGRQDGVIPNPISGWKEIVPIPISLKIKQGKWISFDSDGRATFRAKSIEKLSEDHYRPWLTIPEMRYLTRPTLRAWW